VAVSEERSSPRVMVAGPPKIKAVGGWLEQESVLGYLFILPALIILLVFVAYPFFFGLWLSLTDARIGVSGRFVGLSNFVSLISDSIFLQTTRNAFVYTGVTTVFKFLFGMAIALLLHQRFKLQRLARAAVLLPWIVPTVLSAIAWLWMYDSTFSVINWVLRRFGIEGPIWLGDGRWPLISLMVVNIWRGMPFYGISFLAGMQTIPEEFYEAAEMDGASPWNKFQNITLPLLRPVILVVLLLSIILTFADFQLIWVLTRGGPANSTHLFATLAYQVGLASTQIGMGAAISLFMFPVLSIVVFLIIRSLRSGD
jgi:multiple sugar transport system permease protein